jgi:hypothetical protein
LSFYLEARIFIRIRICIRVKVGSASASNKNQNPDPHLDPHPDPHQCDANPQHCFPDSSNFKAWAFKMHFIF